MKKLVALTFLSALIPAVALGASFKFKDEVRAGKTLAVSFPASTNGTIALVEDPSDPFVSPIAAASTFNAKKGKVSLKVPKSAEPGDYTLVYYEERAKTCKDGRCVDVRSNLRELGTVEVVAKKAKR